MLGIAELWESYWSFRAAIASAGVALLTYPEWLPGTIRFVRRKDIGKGHEVAAELDRLYEAAHHIIHSKNSDGMKEAVETYERLRPRYAHLLLPPRVSFPPPDTCEARRQTKLQEKELLERLAALADTFRRNGYKGGLRRAEEGLRELLVTRDRERRLL